MFEKQDDKNFSVAINPNQAQKITSQPNPQHLVIILVILLSVFSLALIAFMGWWFIFRPKTAPSANQTVNKISTSTLPGNYLPTIKDLPQTSTDGASSSSAVTVSYGSLYEYQEEGVQNKTTAIDLPLNVKTQTTNYYEIARKIPLDSGLASLNDNGYALIPSYRKEADNFYSAYQSLISDGLPQLLTNDFLLYDFENHLKETYLDIKTQVFYKDIWTINRRLYDIANNRYLLARKSTSNLNDELVEAERLESAYYAVALMLLRPRTQQINTSGTLSENLFSSRDAKEFDFILPDYLKADVEKEVSLILEARKNTKSPVMLYIKNYQDFQIANQANARLLNFSLVTKWLNSVFPLNEKGDSCPNCGLDQNDWLVNFITANLIAGDFNSTDELKNIWARIYKVSSYFEGLRKELSYMQYVDALKEKEGPDFNLEKIFSSDKSTEEKRAKAIEIRDFISQKYSYSTLEGGYPRDADNAKHLIGMRMLQESYWPDDYIFKQLVWPVVGQYNGTAKLPAERLKYKLFTSCSFNAKDYQRCRPTASDILNLIAPIDNSDVFLENAKFDNYDTSAGQLSGAINAFNSDSWHENIYWTLLNVSKTNLFEREKVLSPINITGTTWRQRDDNTVLGAWVSLKTGVDKLELTGKKDKGFTDSAVVDIYIEPNPRLIGDLLANAKMVDSMLGKLNITDDAQYSSKKLSELISDLTVIKKMLAKQMANEKLSDYEEVDLANIISRFRVTNKNSKIVKYQFKNSTMTERVDGIKFVVSVYSSPAGKKLVVGPVFNHVESD